MSSDGSAGHRYHAKPLPDGYYLYKYEAAETGEIIYIGLTKSVKKRIMQHDNEDRFKPYADCAIYYHECGSRHEMRALETALIVQHSPLLNISCNSGASTARIDVEWELWWSPEYEKEMQKEQENEALKFETEFSIRVACKMFNQTMEDMPGSVEQLFRHTGMKITRDGVDYALYQVGFEARYQPNPLPAELKKLFLFLASCIKDDCPETARNIEENIKIKTVPPQNRVTKRTKYTVSMLLTDEMIKDISAFRMVIDDDGMIFLSNEGGNTCL